MRNMYSVNEFSKISGVEASTLRYWDKIGLFSPVGRDPENNYRYYSLAQLTTLNFVATMSDLGIPIKTIAELRKSRNPEKFLRLLEMKDMELDVQLRKLQERASIMHTRRELIRYGMFMEPDKLTVVHREVEWYATLWPRNEYNEGDTFLEPLTKFINQSESLRINLGFPIGGRYDDFDSFIESPERPDNFFSIDPTGANVRRKGDYLVGCTRGYYGELGELPGKMAQYIAEHGLQPTGHVYLFYPHDEACYMEQEQYLGQVMVPV